MSFLEVRQGDSPLILGLPHTGTQVPGDIAKRLNRIGQALADTDWHVHRLYDGLVPEATTVRTLIHRYVIDVNRDPADSSLYPGQNTTSLCPLTDFDGCPIYNEGAEPDGAEITRRLKTFHAPYHAALSAEIARIRALHGFAILFDCHSIRSRIPFLFEGVLPDFNIGTDGGSTCADVIQAAVLQTCEAASDYSTIVNGRFKGGWTTRHYGRPGDGVHAIQLELAQSTYMMEAPPWTYNDVRASQTRVHLRAMLRQLASMSKKDVS